jgi:hypothetical protein
MQRKWLQCHIAHKKSLLAVPHFHIADSSFFALTLALHRLSEVYNIVASAPDYYSALAMLWLANRAKMVELDFSVNRAYLHLIFLALILCAMIEDVS